MTPAKNTRLLLSFFFLPFQANAQVKVTGHATAEVVEAVSATSGTNNLLALQQNATPENLDLGSFTLSGGSNALCSVVVNSTPLKSESGHTVNFNAGSTFSNNTGILNDRGTQVFSFKGETAREILNKKDREYEGQYNVVFAYN